MAAFIFLCSLALLLTMIALLTDLGVVRFVRIITWMYTDRNTARRKQSMELRRREPATIPVLRLLLVRGLFCKRAPSNA